MTETPRKRKPASPATPPAAPAVRDPVDRVLIYTDGACSGNPGPGGYGAILSYKGVSKEISGFDPETTNNRMEMMAVISALEALTRSSRVLLRTDSRYVMDGITKWIHGWRRNNWRTADKKPVKNIELWQRLDLQMDRHEVEFEWVRGHTGDPGNEAADQLARDAIQIGRTNSL